MVPSRAAVAAALAAMVATTALHTCAAQYYSIDRSFPAGALPFNTSRVTSVGVDETAGLVYVAQRNAALPAVMVFGAADGQLKRTWGTPPDIGSIHGLRVVVDGGEATVWVTDVQEFTVKQFTTDGKLLRRFGDQGVAGSATDPLQFGNVADIAFDGATGSLWASDGDGGVNNRFVKLNATTGALLYVVGEAAAGTGPSQFSSPHSIAFHARTDTVWVADRGNNRTQTFAASTGKFLGEWTCLHPLVPWGLRIDVARDRLLMADGTSDKVAVFDLSGATAAGPGPCVSPMQVIAMGTGSNTAHELGIDQRSGDVYVTEVGVPTAVQRLTRNK